MNIGDVVWLNSGQGPYTILALDEKGVSATLTQGNPGSLQTLPVVCLSLKNPTPQLEYDRQTEASTLAALSAKAGIG